MVEIHDPHRGVDGVRHLVHIATGGQAGTDIDAVLAA